MTDGTSVVELRTEVKAALQAQYDLLHAEGSARHEKAMLRMDAIEKANTAFVENLNRVPTQLDREVRGLTHLYDEKLKLMDARIGNLNEFATAMRTNIKEAIDAALAATKELSLAQAEATAAAVAKSDIATAREIEALKVMIASTSKGFDTEIANLTDRFNRGEGLLMGGKGVVTAAIATVGVVVSIYLAIHAITPSDLSSRMDALSAKIDQLETKPLVPAVPMPVTPR